ncbi:MAG: hypothetical protein IJ363_10315 [Clostridia bacterium]|nr:hypothetical protein [Clostridia bacterium]
MASGMDFLGVSRVSVYTRMKNQTHSPHPPPTVVPLPRWGRLTKKPTDKPKFEGVSESLSEIPNLIAKMKFPSPNPAKPLDGSPKKWYNNVSVFSSEVLI